LPAAVHSPAAISGGRLFVGCDDGRVYALDLDTGVRCWEFAPENGARVRSGPAVAEGVVVAAAANGFVYGLDESSGEERWRFRAGLSVTSSVGISGKQAFVAAYDGRVCAVSLARGELSWDFVIPGDFIAGSPAVGGGRVYVAALGTGEGGGTVYALDETTGAVQWKTPLQGWLGNTAAFAGDRVVVAATGFKTGGLYALDSKTGAILWGPVRGASNQWSSPAVSADTVYAGNTGWLYAVDLGTGALKWRWKAPVASRRSGGRVSQYEALVRTPVISGDRLYIGSYFEIPGPDEIHVISSETGEDLWSNEIPWRAGSGLSVENGNVIIGGTGGEIEAWSPVDLIMNGKGVQFQDIGPVLLEGRTWVPCRAMFEAAGFTVGWDSATRTVSCVAGGSSIVMTAGSPVALINGAEVVLDAPLRIMSDRVMAQPRAIVKALGGSIEWDPVKYNVFVRLE